MIWIYPPKPPILDIEASTLRLVWDFSGFTGGRSGGLGIWIQTFSGPAWVKAPTLRNSRGSGFGGSGIMWRLELKPSCVNGSYPQWYSPKPCT